MTLNCILFQSFTAKILSPDLTLQFTILALFLSDLIASFSFCLVIPLDTGCKLNVHKTFKKDVRLPNVLCTYNLRHIIYLSILRVNLCCLTKVIPKKTPSIFYFSYNTVNCTPSLSVLLNPVFLSKLPVSLLDLQVTLN